MQSLRSDHLRLDGWLISRHAVERAIQLGFSIPEVLKAASEPEVSYRSHPRYGDDAWLHQRGDCAVGVRRIPKVIQTVLLRKVEQWTHDQGRDNVR